MLERNKRWAFSLGVFMLLFVVCMGVLVAPCSATGTPSLFSDVGDGEPNAMFIQYLTDRGIMNGFPDGTFHPRQGLTRAEAAVLMVRTSGVQSGSDLSGFGDVPSSHWAASSIAAAVEAGYVKGYPDGNFRPEQKLSRVEAVALLLRLSKQEHTASLPLLRDVDESHWAAGAVAEALASGMAGITKEDHSFRPDIPMLRSDLARALAVLITGDAELYQTGLPCELKIKKGSIKVIRNGENLLAEPAMPIETGDRIQVGNNGEAELLFPDGTGFYLQENTDLLVKESRGRSYLKTNGTAGVATDWLYIELKQGKIFGALPTNSQTVPEQENQAYLLQDQLTIASAGGALGYLAAAKQNQPWYLAKKDKKVKVKVDMPWGVAAIRGTYYSLYAGRHEELSMSVLTGDGELSAGGKTVQVGAGQETTVGSSLGQPGKLRKMSFVERQAWNQVHEWALERANRMMRERQAILSPPSEPLAEGVLPANPPHTPELPTSGEEARLNTAFQAIGSNLGKKESSSSHSDHTQSVLIDSIANQTVGVNESTFVNIVSMPAEAALTVDNNNPDVATVSLSENQLTLEGNSEGTATITVNGSMSGYNAGSMTFIVEVTDEDVWKIIEPNAVLGTWSMPDAVVLEGEKIVTRALTIECDPTYDFASYDVNLFEDEGSIARIGDELSVVQPFYYLGQVLNEDRKSEVFIRLINDKGNGTYAILDDNHIIRNAASKKISATISLPEGHVAPDEGVYVSVWLNGQTSYGNYHNYGKVFIPAEQSSTSFEFSVLEDSYLDGYTLEYELNFDNWENTVLNGSYKVDGEVDSFNVQLLEGISVGGTLGIGQEVTERFGVTIIGESGDKKYRRWLEIEPGATAVPFSMVVPANQEYIFGYRCDDYEHIPAGLVAQAYYLGEDGMTVFSQHAQSVPVTDASDEIYLSMLEGVNLSGTIYFPTGIEVPDEGLEVFVNVSAWGEGDEEIGQTTSTVVTILGGESEVDYSITIPEHIGWNYEVFAESYTSSLSLQKSKNFVLVENQDAVNLSLRDYRQRGYFAEDVVPNSVLMRYNTYALQNGGFIGDAYLNYAGILYLKTLIETEPDTYEECWFDLRQAENSEYLIKQNAITNTDQMYISDMVKDLSGPVQIDTVYARNITAALTFSHPIQSAENQIDGSPTRITLITDQGPTEYNLCIRQGENDPLILENIEVPNIAENNWKAVLTVPDVQYNQEYSVVLYQGNLDEEDMVIIATRPLVFIEDASCGSTAIISTQGEQYNLGDKFVVLLDEKDGNTNPEVLDKVSVHVYSESDEAGIDIDLTEIEEAGLFKGDISLSNTTAATPPSIRINPGDRVTVEYKDESDVWGRSRIIKTVIVTDE